MSTNKYLQEKLRLKDFLQRRGVTYDKKHKTWRCPKHDDNHPSATLYENTDGHILHCNVCDENWNIFAVCSIMDGIPNDKEHFAELLKRVRSTLGMLDNDIPEERPKQKTPLPFPPEKKDAFNKKIIKLAKDKEWGENAGSWKYYDKDKNVIALDVRFEKQGERKNILTFWYDGKLKWYGAPVFIYGLDRLDKSKKVMIHEGAKCADIAQEKLSEWNHLSWSGGSGKAHLAKWKILKDYDCYMLPDDDQKKYPEGKLTNAGKIKPSYEQPGIKAALAIKEKLPNLKIIRPYIPARKIKPDGADIEEILQVMTPEEFTEYALNPDNHLKGLSASPEPLPKLSDDLPHTDNPPIPSGSGLTNEPFKILGIGDDGKAYFLTEANRLYDSKLDSLNKNKLQYIANLHFWKINYPAKNTANWEDAMDDLIRLTQFKDFDKSSIRGRGAWKDGDLISYHDGVKTYGEYDKKKIYLRLPRVDIGLNDTPIEKNLMNTIKEIIFELNFDTKTDAVRCMGWSVLAPFAGALSFRPAILITGKSSSGKTTIANLIMMKIGNCLGLNGAESTSAFIRQKVGYDSISVILDEAETKTDRQKLNRTELFSLMRSSTSDDSFDTGKGGKDGVPISYKMRNMFCFIAIDPTIDNVADENRIYRINIVQKTSKKIWTQKEKEIKKYITEKNCRSIRAYTWKKLKNIFNLADRVVPFIQEKTNRDFRSSYSDSLLASAYIIIWDMVDNPSDKAITNMLEKYYVLSPPEEKRDEAEEFLNDLYETIVEIYHEESNIREKITIYECMINIYEMENPKNYIMFLSRCGIKITTDNEIAIANNSAFIKKTMNVVTGYSKLLKRHKNYIRSDSTEYFPHNRLPKKCTIMKSIIEDKKEDNKIESDDFEQSLLDVM